MLIDAHDLPENEVLEKDICVIGSGPAGLTLALEFLNRKQEVCLVESGGLNFDEETQELAGGEVIGDPYPSLSSLRCRQLGGTSHYWEAQAGYHNPGFRCLPLDDIDFEERSWIPHSGWPFKKIHLDPFYERAHKVCQIGSYSYGVNNQEDEEDQPDQPLPFKGDCLLTKMSYYGFRKPFTSQYPEKIRQSKNVTVLIHANVIDIRTNESSNQVERVKIACLQGKQFFLKAKIFVLATGGIENARMLLLANHQQKEGLGNQHDLVGRFFMERPVVKSGMLVPRTKQLFKTTALYDVKELQGTPAMAWVAMQQDFMRSEHLMNNGAQLFPKPLPRQIEATRSARKLFTLLKKRQFSDETTQLVIASLRGFDYLVSAGFWSMVRRFPGLQRGDWSYLPYEKQRFSLFEVIYQIEQAPNPNNRVVLGDTLDRLGLPRVKVNWQLNDIDIQNIERVQDIWKAEFKKAGIGDLQLCSSKDNLIFYKPAMAHHIGTTRMSDSPRYGVVDANCCVHGIANLFVAGSSVFPTAGYANPTLTIIALALRLADHIKTVAKI
ncbi:GMC oxidoreductase [Acaryochloris sp. IP29b_bin.137]|uniref:GMC oxidoreductase n=1 Tax=Acaryochloris sp. IP29b_bin.137 TaxID=2969217 RepID=UPI002625284C|nr:GMC oxidoreductase [Acaryochloris sp. IP29b_bin.137]